ncbi:uncharacterized protein LOC143293943 [Babylonia areolata]|uniref:uncharacterized protein LOC143293943 n=1 Tax=Babylonia areolata TaxID=304850 RepID=UPI003FD01B6E
MASQREKLMPLMSGQVTHIVDPGKFWLRMGSEEDLSSLKDFEQRLNVVAPNLPVGSVNSVKESAIMLVCCSKSGKHSSTLWKRAQVVRVDREHNSFDVWYLDYGNTEIVPARRVRVAVPENIQSYPTFCYLCALAGIKPIAKSWTTRGVKTFENLVLQRTFSVATVVYDQNTFQHRVNLYPAGESSRSVAHQMLDAETGLPTGENVQEYLRDVVLVTCEEVYGSFVEDTDLEQPQEEMPEHGSTEDSSQLWEACSEPTASLPQSHADQNSGISETQTAVYGGATGGTTGCAPQGQTEGASDGVGEVMVPGFNLSGLQQREMPGAEELQRKQEEMQRALRRARLQKDMIECQRHMENLMMTSGQQGQQWGNTDLAFRYWGQGVPDVEGSGVVQGSMAAADGTGSVVDFGPAGLRNLSLYPEDKGLKQHQDYVPEAAAAVLGQGDSEGGAFLPQEPAVIPAGLQHLWTFPPPPEPHPSWTAEEREFRTQEYIRQVLKGAVLMDRVETDVLCSLMHCLAPLDAEQCAAEMKVVLDVLVEEAVKDEAVRDLALQLFQSYTCVLKGEMLLNILKHGTERFVKLPVGKMPSYSTDFTDVMIRLLCQASDWPIVLKNVVQDFTLTCLEKWIIFNKKGLQTGLMFQQLEGMYLTCAELLLPPSLSLLHTAHPHSLSFLHDQMREKVLETDVDYSVRSRLLTLLLSCPPPPPDSPDTSAVGAGETDTRVGLPRCDQSVQVDTLPSLPAPQTSSQRTGVVTTAAVGSQTEEEEEEGGAGRREAWVQTDVGVEVGVPTPRRGSQGSGDWSLGSGEVLDSLPTAPGRARRRRVLLEYLNKKKQEASGGGGGDGSICLGDGASSPRIADANFGAAFTPTASNTWKVRAESPTVTGTEASVDTLSVVGVKEKTTESEVAGSVMEVKEKTTESEVAAQGSSARKVGVECCGSVQESPAMSFLSAMSSVSQVAYTTVFGNHWSSAYGTEPSSSVTGQQYMTGPSSVDAVPREDSSPSKEDSSPSKKDSSPSKEDSSPSKKDSSPSKEDSSPSKKDNSVPVSNDSEMQTHFTNEPENLFNRDRGEGGEVDAEKFDGDEFDSDSSDKSSVSDFGGTDDQWRGAGSRLDPADQSAAGDEEEEEWACDFPQHGEHHRRRFYGEAANSMNNNRSFYVEPDRAPFSPEDFPALSTQTQTTQPSSSDSSCTELTLDTIAVGLLESDMTGSRQSKALAVVCSEGEDTKDPLSTGSGSGGAVSSPGCNEVYISEDTDRDSVPSDWEDRCRASASDTGGKGASGDAGKPKAGGSTPMAEPVSQGGWWKMKPVATHHQMDPAGDSSASQSSLSSFPFRKVAPENTNPAVLDAGNMASSWLPAASSESDAPSPASQSTSSTPPCVGSPGAAVPYQRGDLAGTTEVKSKGRKKKFRPFMAPATVVPSPANMPLSFDPFCSNCKKKGHLRLDCPEPLKSILF